jgi:protein tyrosine phosphatase
VQDCIDRIDKKELTLIHCSAGIGRTGTLGAMVEALRCAKKYNELSVFEIVQNMRNSRMGCVQTPEQYTFIYQQLQKML